MVGVTLLSSAAFTLRLCFCVRAVVWLGTGDVHFGLGRVRDG